MRWVIKFLSCVSTCFLFALTAYAGEVIFFYHTDPAGTPLAMTDSNGNVAWRGEYKPFGEEMEITPEPENKLKFVGKEKDKETGLYYFRARYMEPKIGRFIAPDSIGAVDHETGIVNNKILKNPQRINLYAYGLNNPYRYIDPDGKQPIGPIIIDPSRMLPNNTPSASDIMEGLKRGNQSIQEAGKGTGNIDDTISDAAKKAEKASKYKKSLKGQKTEHTPSTHPDEFGNVKGSPAKVNEETGEIWYPDRKHKDHYEVYKNKKKFERGERDRAVYNDGRLKEKTP